MLAFPEDYKILVPKLLIETMATVGASFVSRLNHATGDVVPETKALAKGPILNFFLVSYIIQIIFMLVYAFFHFLAFPFKLLLL